MIRRTRETRVFSLRIFRTVTIKIIILYHRIKAESIYNNGAWNVFKAPIRLHRTGIRESHARFDGSQFTGSHGTFSHISFGKCAFTNNNNYAQL